MAGETVPEQVRKQFHDMKSIEIEARTSREAIKIALKRLGVSRDQVNVEILSEEHKGLFGMKGARPARIKVTLKNKV